ncbi:hypothetical protein [Thiohalomonas denitrificans]|uniref:Uncharacterized protein n=1 Tax=Thiohalomonas denitrificans TaxID=415747 RepID=A0A1G5QL09_9GAMM|nr:hypothetical protein [Thiohalomonas denitrificans]SCZ62240.1 hypothetical protein SAMN03097708_02283 [Thiohalomonas denitrificans]
METRRPSLAEVVVPGLLAGVLFSVAAALFGRRDSGSAVAALNAPGHVIWGESALDERRFSYRHTLPGVVINLGAGLFWAAVMLTLFRGSTHRGLRGALLAGTSASLLAWIIDYHVLPRRLSPGIQERVSGGSLLAIHGLFGLGLAMGARLVGPPNRR